jgi:hypothetical protein
LDGIYGCIDDGWIFSLSLAVLLWCLFGLHQVGLVNVRQKANLYLRLARRVDIELSEDTTRSITCDVPRRTIH